MKTIRQLSMLFMLLFVTQIAKAQAFDMPLNFDSTNVTYTFTDFGGNTSSIVTDPVASNNKVAKVIKSNTAEVWAGTTMGGTTGFATAIAFNSSRTIIRMRVYSPDSGIAVRLKVEDPNDGAKSVETEARTTASNSWQTLTFNFINNASGTAAINYTYNYKKASVFFNFGVNGLTAGTKIYYFDDVNFPAATGPILSQITLPIYFDSINVNYTTTNFGGNATTIITDPTNSLNKVAQTVKSNTAETWSGTTIGTPSGLANAIPFSSGNAYIRVKVYSPNSGIQVRLKAEDPNDPTKSVETEVTTTTANAWETLTFNFANQATGTAAINYGYTYRMLTIFFNFGVTGAIAGTKTYLWDNVEFGNGTVVPQLNMPVTFESTTLNYGLTDFGGNTSSIVVDPAVSTNKACKVIKSNTAELWAGTTIGGTTGFGTVIPFTSTSKTISMRIYSPSIGTPIRMKVEDPNDAGKSVETEATTSVANAWQTLQFNFENQATGTAAINLAYSYKKLTVFFNFGTTGAIAGEKTYYFDDVTFGTITPPAPLKTYLTFQVDMAKNKPTTGDTVTLNGTFNGWCGACTPMTNKPGTNIWMATLLLNKDSSYDFKYSIGNWKSQETLKEGLSCTTTKSGFTNRTITVSKLNDTLPTVCWESCVSCLNTAPKAKVTFKVNMKNYVDDSLSIKGVTLNGNFNGWCGDCTKMTAIGNKIYSVTLTLDTGSYDYKFSVGNWLDQEQFIATDPCTKTVGNYTNRYLSVKDTASIIAGTYCWNTCTKCEAIGVAEQALNNVKIYPNPTTETLFIEMGQFLERDSKVLVYNMLGELMISKTSNQNNGNGTINLDTHSLKQGIYLLKIEADNAVKTIKFQIN